MEILKGFLPYKEMDYRIGVIAEAIAVGKKDKLTSDWVRRALLTDVEDGFITYGQAVAVNNKVINAIERVKAIF